QEPVSGVENIGCDKLYDEAWRSDDSDAASLEEVPIDYLDIERNDCEHTVNNAIKEVSNEFLSGKVGPSRQTKYGNSDESHSDTEFKLVRGLAYVARYPESATGMSDNDWNPYGTESDTNVTPRVHSQNGIGPKLSGSRKSSLTSFNPKLHSTDLNLNTPSVAVHSIPDYDSSAKDTDEKSKSKTFFLLQPEISADAASVSGSSQETKQSNSDDSHPETEFRLVRGVAYVARYPESAAGMSDHEWNTYGTESDTSVLPLVQSQNGKGSKLSGSMKSSLTSFSPQLHSTDLNVNTPSAAICSISDYDSNTESTNKKSESNKSFFLLQPEISADFASVSLRKKTMNLSKPASESSVNPADLNKTFRGSNLSTSSIFTKRSSHRSTVDYNLLQKELQSIQDNLHVRNPEMRLDLSELDNTVSRQSVEQTCFSSSSDCDVIPSTTVTPDRHRNQMAWDYAADLGYQQPGGLMGDISLETFTTNSHRPSSDKKSFNSDGDETRTSDSSDRVIDHAAADRTLAEMSQVLHPQAANHQTSYSSVDQMLCNFENQRQQIESGYQQLNNPGLAEKVSRILASQDPQSQASGILLEVTAQERQMRSQLIVNPQRKDFNFSVAVSEFNESAESLAKPDNVRKRLDLSGLSSTEVSRLVDSSTVYVPARKGFLAFDDVARLLSSQMVKASERTFNSSLEAVVPHRTIQCYPLTVDSKIQQQARDEKPEEDIEKASDHPSENRPNWSAEGDRSEHTSSPAEIYAAKSEQNSNMIRSHDDSDSSSGRRREKYRPYRPAGSKEVYYTESDVASVADSATTMESTHFGSDDARGPVLPPSVLGSRQDAPNAPGIYGNKQPILKQHGDILPPIQEKSGLDDRESETSQSRKDNFAVESVNSHGKSPDESSSFADLERTSGPKKNDISNQHENVSKTNNRHSRSVAEREHSSQRSEPVPVTVGGASNGRWANTRNQQERDIYELQTRIKSRNGVQNSENNNNLSYDDFHPVSRQNQRVNNFYERHTDVSLHSHHSDTLRQRDRTTQALLLRSHTPYDEYRDEIDSQKYANPQVVRNRGRILYSTTDVSAYSPSRFHSENDERYFTKRYNDADREFSRQDPLSLPERRYHEEVHRTLHRSHSDEDMSACGRDKYQSRNSPHLLSSDLRKTTGTVSSHPAERSLRLSPQEWSDHQQTNVRRTQSPPPTFLARERGQVPRSYTPGLRPPAHPTRHIEEHSSAPRAMFTSRNMDDLRQPTQFMNPADRLVVTSPESDNAEFDHQPVSQRTQLLTQALSQDKDPGVQPDIDALWEQFKANNESSETSLNTSSLEAVTDLILHPSPHLVTQCLKEREEHLIQRQERAEAERVQRRAELLESHVRQSSSEDDMNVRYAAMISQKEEERLKRRAAKKKKGKSTNLDTEAENCMDNLFSIAEDASFDQTPNKCNSALSAQSSNIPRRPHVIDPNMKKLRERISNQRQIIDKSTLKEIQKIEKLKKLEHLLSAKRRNEISDQTLKRQLEEISSVSIPASDESQEGVGKLVESHNTTPLSDDSTTAKDSSTEMHSWKTHKEMRRKMMQAKETELKNQYSSIKGSKYKSSLFARNIQHGEQLEPVSSESKLLKLVAEGILTAEEAYRIAVEREAAFEGKTSREANHKSTVDDIYYKQNSRLHRLFSPYVRADHHHAHKNHYVPKVKSPQSMYDMAASYPEPWYEQDSLQNSTDVSDAADPCHLGPDYRIVFAPIKTSQKAQPGTSSRAHSAPSVAKSTQPESIKYRGKSPPRSATVLTFSPVRHQKRSSPHRQQSPTSYERRVSPSRSLASPRNKENNAKLRQNKKSTHRGSVRHEKIHRSEQKSMQRQKSPVSGGIAWHIPLDVPQDKCKLPSARKGMPLQERQLVTNTLSKKAKEQSLQSEDVEPLQGWQMTEKMGHKNWQKPDQPKGISDELWEHDPLATKVNHRDVDPLMDRVEFILSKHSGNSSTEDEKRTLNGKPLSKLSLQEALLARKQSFISKCKERQKRLALAREHRKLQECLRLEREALFMDLQQMAAANINAHPYSDNLYQPKRRFFSKQEMKEITMKRYKKLPEVLQKQESVKKMEQCQLNRLRADIFNRKVQRELLRKQSMRRR
ncbi:unnamed protein product, partial [Candidula unifasciata]